MAEKKFTEAGEAGQRIRDALVGAYRGFNSGFTNYVQEPLLNLYPQVIANPTYAATEAVAGALDVPLDLGRFPYYDIETENERSERLLRESEPPTPTPTLANRDLLSEYYGGFDNVPIRRAEPVNKKKESKKLNYVVKTYGENPTSEIFTDKEKAKAALKSLYAKNQKATMSNVPEDQAEQFAVGSMEKIAKNKEAIRKLRNPQTEEEVLRVAENKGRMEEAWKIANEEKRAKDKEAGAGFADWKAKVKAGREWETPLNNYNQQLSLLKQAYAKAGRERNPYAQFTIGRMLDAYQEGVPKEMGARRKAAQSGVIQEKNQLLLEAMQAQREQLERERQTRASNPDFDTYYYGG